MNLFPWNWQAIEAVSSGCTAVFTLGSLLYLAKYTKTTMDGYEITLRSEQDRSRPALMLIEVKPADAPTVAIFKNAGCGIAINVVQEMPDGTLRPLDSNAVAPNHSLTITLSDSTIPTSFVIRYESLGGNKCCTVSRANQGNRLFNQYFPKAGDAEAKVKAAKSLIADQGEMARIAAQAIAIKKRNS